MQKCNPLQWLWGLLPLCLLWWLGLLGTQPRIEQDLAQRAKEHLEKNNLSWASVVFKGRDGTIVGRAEEESEQRRPATEVAKLWGVRTLEDRVEVLQLVRNYVWNATTRDGVLALSGFVPNEAARKSILASARTSFPKHKVEDRMEPARGAPDQKQWLGGTAFAMRQLAALKPGGRAVLEATALTIEGEADSAKAYETVRTELGRPLPQGVSLKTERVIPPLIKPYTWGAVLRGRQIELTGHVPNVGARDQIKAAASKALAGATVVDRMTLASGAPAEWQKVATTALTRLGQLRQGNAEMLDTQLTVTGLTETEETAQSVRTALRNDMPLSFRLTEQIRQDPAIKAAEDARRAAEEAQREAARRAAAEAEARARAAEEASRRAAAEAEARRVAELQRQQMTDSEARTRAAEEAARRKAEEEAQRQSESEARRRAAAEAEARRNAEEAAKRAAADAEARRQAELRRQAEAEEQARRLKAEQERAAQAKAEADARARTAEGRRCQQSLATAIETGTITFQRASAELDRRSHQTLDQLARIAKGCPGFALEVGGHTDNEGEPGRNQRLSERRAQSVLDYLVKVGVPAASLTAVGYGETQPKAPNDSPANMARNRRIELSVKAK